MRKLLKQLFRQYRQQPQGQGLTEYALILGLVALAVFAIVQLMRPAIEDTFSRFASRAPVAPPSLANYTPPPTNTIEPTLDVNATHTLVPSPTNTVESTNTPTAPATATNTPTATATPACLGYGPYSVPGSVQMEAFACGGSNVAFVDSTGDGGPGSGAYRQETTTEGPDLGSVGGGYYVGWLVPNEWIVYNVNAANSQMYDFSFQVASASGNGRFRFEILRNNQVIHTSNSVAVPSTGGDQSWSSVNVPQIPLMGGDNQIRIIFESGGFNIDYFNIFAAAAQPTATHTPTPTNTPTAVPTNTPTATATAAAAHITLIDVDFEQNREGFDYRDNAFYGTNQSTYADGDRYTSRNSWYVDSNGALVVILGGVNGNPINNMSGGWDESFILSTAAPVNIRFRYRLVMANDYEWNECSEVLVAVDGQLYGSGNNNYVNRRCDGTDTNWQPVSIQTGQLAAGAHTLTIGGFNNQKTQDTEKTWIFIDDVFAETN